MKKNIFIVMFAILALVANAQSDYSKYLNKALERLEVGDCESARKNYNVYKELSGKSASSVEILLKDCNRKESYSVGETMIVGDETYIVAYIREDGNHGLAILNKGWQQITNNVQKYVTQRGIPTPEEMKVIYMNRDLLGLYDKYWTCVYSNNCTCTKTGNKCMAAMDFLRGEFISVCPDFENCVVLLVHRF